MLNWIFDARPAAPRPSIVDVLASFNRPWALRWFGLVNAGAAIFYGGLATYGVLVTMFPGLLHDSDPRYTITEMVALMERSATHTALAGLAFVVVFVTKAAAIVTTRNDPPVAANPPPKAHGS